MIRRERDHVVLIIFHVCTRTKLLDLERERHAVHTQAHDVFEGAPGRGGSENA